MNFSALIIMVPKQLVHELSLMPLVLVHELSLMPLVGHRLDFEGHTLRVENPDANLLRSQGHDGGYGHPGEPGSGAGVLLDRKGEIKPPSVMPEPTESISCPFCFSW